MGLEENEVPTYAPSLPVPNVQEMVKLDPLSIPEKYIRSEEDIPRSTDPNHLSNEIPIIDLSMISNGDENGDEDELKKLDLLKEMKKTAAEFFDLPLEEKNKFSMPPDDIQGYGHAYVVSEEQKLDWSDTLILIVFPSHFRKLQLWPTEQTENFFCDISFPTRRSGIGALRSYGGVPRGLCLELPPVIGFQGLLSFP